MDSLARKDVCLKLDHTVFKVLAGLGTRREIRMSLSLSLSVRGTFENGRDREEVRRLLIHHLEKSVSVGYVMDDVSCPWVSWSLFSSPG